MMEKSIHRQLIHDALEALAEQRLNDAHIIIRTLCKECGEMELTNRFESIESDYRAMLDFIAQGGIDEKKDENFLHLCTRSYLLLCSIEEELVLRDYSHRLHPDLFQSDYVDYEYLETVFYATLTNKQTSYDRTKEKRDKLGIMSKMLPLISRTTALKLYWVNDPDLLEEALDDVENDMTISLVGIILSTILHPEMYKFCPSLKEKVKNLMQSDEANEIILYIYSELFLSCQAERIEQHMKDEMMPIMMEAVQDKRLQQEMTEEMSVDDEEADSFEKMLRQQEQIPLTPEQKRKKKQFHTAMRELMDIHSEGVDINTEIFNFAAKLPFFSEMANWFMQFDPHHPALEPICYPNGKPNILFRMLYDVTTLCDIDKYAMTFIMGKRFKSSKFDVMIAGIQNLVEDSQALKNMDFVLPRKTDKENIADFIHTLYRFVTKSAWKDELPNVFTRELPFCTDELLSIPLRKNTKAALELGDRMWKFGIKNEAVKMYELVDEVDKSLDVERCLRIASYYDEQYSDRDEAYVMRAYAEAPDDRDVLYAMFRRYQRHTDFDRQLEVLDKLSELYPEDAKVISHQAEIYIFLNEWEKAKQLFFKLEYLEKKVLYAQRGIVLCSLHQQKFDVALRYSRKIFNTTGSANWNDYLKGGHAAWMMDDMNSALTFYHLYIKNYLTDDPSITDALNPFKDDVPLLLSLGKTSTDISLMRDMITLKAI